MAAQRGGGGGCRQQDCGLDLEFCSVGHEGPLMSYREDGWGREGWREASVVAQTR